ncbi:MAG TPA: HAD family hydrolase [Ktedonobacteraceae bacterium]
MPLLYHRIPFLTTTGNRTFMQQLDISVPLSLLSERKRRVEVGQICSFIAVEKQVEGLLVLEVVPCPELSRFSADLRAAGIKETILPTGDSDVVAQQIGAIAKVDRVISRCLPQDNVRTVEELVQQGHRVLMVGDGMNDAPHWKPPRSSWRLARKGSTPQPQPPQPRCSQRISCAWGAQSSWVDGSYAWLARACGLAWVSRRGHDLCCVRFHSSCGGAVLQEVIDVIIILNAIRAGRINFSSETLAHT